MEHSDFKMGEVFWCKKRQWRTTYIGSRVVAAVCIDPEEKDKLEGYPFHPAVMVFDADELGGCTTEQEKEK